MISRDARNHLQGVRIADCVNVVAGGNLVEGNDDNGIFLDAMFDGNQHAEVRNNIAQNNARWGIKMLQSPHVNLKDNTLRENGQPGISSAE